MPTAWAGNGFRTEIFLMLWHSHSLVVSGTNAPVTPLGVSGGNKMPMQQAKGWGYSACIWGKSMGFLPCAFCSSDSWCSGS